MKDRGTEAQDTAALPRPAWNGWSGGDCPVAADTLVDVKFRPYHSFPDDAPGEQHGHRADFFRWAHAGTAGDVVAWRRSMSDIPTGDGRAAANDAALAKLRTVERVARAIYEAADDRTGWPWDRSALGGQEYWIKLAQAAMRAVGEP